MVSQYCDRIVFLLIFLEFLTHLFFICFVLFGPKFKFSTSSNVFVKSVSTIFYSLKPARQFTFLFPHRNNPLGSCVALLPGVVAFWASTHLLCRAVLHSLSGSPLLSPVLDAIFLVSLLILMDCVFSNRFLRKGGHFGDFCLYKHV